MKKRRKKGSVSTVPVTIRLPVNLARRLQIKARGVPMSRSAYIAALLEGEEPSQHPALAALAHLIAIYEIVRTTGDLADEQLAELRAILGAFARLAREEALR